MLSQWQNRFYIVCIRVYVYVMYAYYEFENILENTTMFMCKILVFRCCLQCHFKTLRNRRFRFPGAAAGNAQAVLNVPPLLIVQPRKHRKLPTTSVWNGRNCSYHGSTKIRLRRSYTCILRWSRPASVRETGLHPEEEKGLKCCFSPNKKNKEKRPGCVSSRQRTATAGRDCWN